MATKLGSNSIVKKMLGNKEVLKEVLNGVVVYTNTPPTYPYVTFSSPNTFTIAQAGSKKTWDGTLEYSTDKQNWSTWNGTTTLNSSSTGDTKYLYMRGTDNSYITGNTSSRYWSITGSNVTISGDIENLLDYQDVENGVHPTTGDYTFTYLFYSNSSIVDCSNLVLSCPTIKKWAYASMFYYCQNLVYGPSTISATGTVASNGCYQMFWCCTNMILGPSELAATTLDYYAYQQMFQLCSSLISPPIISATYAADTSMSAMFDNCSSLEDLPKLYLSTFVGSYCCRNMFSACSKIKISTTQTGEYQNAYLLPIGQTTGSNPYQYIFDSTGGTYTGDGTAGTTYYTSNDIIY